MRILRVSLVWGLISTFCAAQSTSQAAAAQPVAQPATSDTKIAEGAASPPASDIAAGLKVPDPLGEAKLLYGKGDFRGAIAKYEQLLQQRPRSPDAYAGIVRAYLKEKKVEQAAEAAERGMAQANSPRVRAARAEVWFRQGKISDAEKEWVEIINSGYPEPRAYLGVARVRTVLAMYKSAKTLIEKAHQLDMYDPDIYDAWIGTLSRAERIKYLEDSLAGENNWSTEEREDTANYLEYLRERSKATGSPCRLVSQISATETPLVRLMVDPSHLRGYGLSVVLNGHKSSLLLDTGASGIVVKRAIAEHAGISKISATTVSGVGKKGRRKAYIGLADSIKVGDLEFKNCSVEVMESRSVGREDGLIGADVFEDFLVEIDFPSEKLRLSELPRRPGQSEKKLALKDGEESDPDTQAASDDKQANDAKAAAPASTSGPQDRYIAPEMQSYTGIFRFGHMLLVPTSIGDVPRKLFLIDSGAATNFISPTAAREVTKVKGDHETIVEGVSGRVKKVYVTGKAVLQFGRLRQQNQDMTAFDTTPISDDVGTEISGFLGFTTLRNLDLKIDYRDALVNFQYSAEDWQKPFKLSVPVPSN